MLAKLPRFYQVLSEIGRGLAEDVVSGGVPAWLLSDVCILVFTVCLVGAVRSLRLKKSSSSAILLAELVLTACGAAALANALWEISPSFNPKEEEVVYGWHFTDPLNSVLSAQAPLCVMVDVNSSFYSLAEQSAERWNAAAGRVIILVVPDLFFPFYWRPEICNQVGMVARASWTTALMGIYGLILGIDGVTEVGYLDGARQEVASISVNPKPYAFMTDCNKNVITHEFGHAIGIAHVSKYFSPESIMHWSHDIEDVCPRADVALGSYDQKLARIIAGTGTAAVAWWMPFGYPLASDWTTIQTFITDRLR